MPGFDFTHVEHFLLVIRRSFGGASKSWSREMNSIFGLDQMSAAVMQPGHALTLMVK